MAQPSAWKAPPWRDLPWSWDDAAKAQAGHFGPSRAAERVYERALRGLAGRIGHVLATHSPREAEEILREYARVVAPWARQTAANMLDGVSRGNLERFRRIAGRMGLDMRAFLSSDAVGRAVAQRIEANTELITTLPLRAALRAGELAHEGLVTGMRAEDMARELAAIGNISRSDARRIALTEVSKASTALTRARAMDIGSEGYIWRSVRDGSTRPSHRAMEGKYVSWDSPPRLDGMTGHAGEFPYCRCYPEPVIPRGKGTRKTFAPALPTQAQEKARGEQRLLTHWERSQGAEMIPHVPGDPLYNVDKARFAPAKLLQYSMDADALLADGSPNERARAKAKRWEHWLGMRKEHAPLVEAQIMAALHRRPAIPKYPADKYGQRFTVYVPVSGPNGRVVDVMTAWIYDLSSSGKFISTVPRMINCFIDSKIDKDGRYRG